MADTKITGLTEDTSPSSSDLVATAKDPGGTPLSRKVTLLNLLKGAILGLLTSDNDILVRAGGVAARLNVPASRILGRKSSGDIAALTGPETFALLGIASATSTLTNKTPNSTSFVQWGTEEAVIAQASAPTSAVVIAWLFGDMVRATGAAGRRGQVKMQVSFDGGSSFADIGTDAAPPVISTTAGMNVPFTCIGRATGTVTGDIQIQALVRDVDAANETTFERGTIIVMCHPQ